MPMQEPAGSASLAPGVGGRQQPARAGTPATMHSARDAEVGHQQHGDGVALGGDPGRRADAALEVEARHPGAGPDRALGRVARGAARGQRRLPGGHARRRARPASGGRR